MTIAKGASQDDYYAQAQATEKADTTDKKPLKLKLKAVIKKPVEAEISVSPIQETPVPEVIESPKEVERPKARLVEREHASS